MKQIHSILHILPALAAVALMGVLLATPAAAAKKDARPNIVIFLSDDHGVDFVGAYGNKVIQTPHIDALATQGLRFTRAFAASPTCAPSRAALYTGLHSARNGLMGNHTDSRPDVKSLPHYLEPLGYRVVLANKTHVRPAKAYPFEYLKATLPRNPAHVRHYRQEGLDAGMAVEFLAEHAKRRKEPLCMVLADNNPHVVWEPNKIYDPAALPVPPIMVDTPVTRRALANYYQDITTMDARVGQIRAALERLKMADNTLFIYTSDQGPEWPHCKWTVYDTGLRVPFIVHWPGKTPPGKVTDAMISFVDVLPTLVEVAGGNPPTDLDGQSFLEVLTGARDSFRDRIHAQHTGDREMNVFPQRGLRTPRYKYVLNLDHTKIWTTHFTLVAGIPESHAAVWDTWMAKAETDPAAAKLVDTIMHHPEEELYDLDADPYELSNIAGRPEVKQTLEQLRAEMKAWMEQVNDPAR